MRRDIAQGTRDDLLLRTRFTLLNGNKIARNTKRFERESPRLLRRRSATERNSNFIEERYRDYRSIDIVKSNAIIDSKKINI